VVGVLPLVLLDYGGLYFVFVFLFFFFLSIMVGIFNSRNPVWGVAASVVLLGAFGGGTCPAKSASFLHYRGLVFGFFYLCVCIFSLFLRYSLFLYYLNFTRIFID
jgi:hypothetical protein